MKTTCTTSNMFAFSTRIQGILTVLLIAFLCSCSEKEKTRTNRHVLVFVDKTMSSTLAQQKQQEQERELQRLLAQCVQQNGDRLQVCLLHETTDQASVVLNEKVQLTEPNAEDEITRKRQESDYQMELYEKQKRMLKQLRSAISEGANSQTARWTNIWDSFEVVGRFAATVPATDTVVVVYLSDMLESMPGSNRRDFHKRSPESMNQAEQWAEEDFVVLSRDMVRTRPVNPGNVLVQFWLPNEAGAHTNGKNVRAYWETLFHKFGMSTASIN